MSKHTEGPWINNGGRIETKKHRPLAVVGEVNNQSFEDTANARLMAASPDLLEALRPLAAWAENERRRHRAAGEENEAEYMGRLADAARAAIAKAEGK